MGKRIVVAVVTVIVVQATSDIADAIKTGVRKLNDKRKEKARYITI